MIAAYLRVSTRKQADEGVSLDAQREEIRRWAERERPGFDVVEYVDDGYSGTTLQRPALEQLLGDLDRVDAVAVWRFDRWSRDPVDRAVLSDQLGDVELVSVTQTFDASPEGELMADLDASLAKYESRKIGLRTRVALRRKAERGDIVTPAPYGYRSLQREPGAPVRWEPVPAEAETVGLIDQLYLDGSGGGRIARRLNDSGVPAPGGGSWSPGAVLRIVDRAVYAGRVEYGRERWSKHRRVGSGETVEAEVAVPGFVPLRDAATWEAIRRERKRRRGRRGRLTSSMFAGVLRCGGCGGRMQVEVDSRRYRRYVCSTHRRHRTCRWNSISQRRLLAALQQQVEAIRGDVEVATVAPEREVVEEELLDVERRRERLIAGFEAGVVTLDDVGERLGRLSERRDVLEGRLKADDETYTVPLADLAKLAGLAPDEVRPWVREFVTEMTWDREADRLTIVWGGL